MPRRRVVSPVARLLRSVSRLPGWVRWALPIAIWWAAFFLLQVVPTTEGPALSPWPAAYVATKLFALDAPGFPKSPDLAWNIALWVVIVAAPLNTATAAADFVRRHLLSGEVMVMGMRDHVVVCGLGEHGRVIAREALRRGFDVVVVDRLPGNVGRGLTLETGEALVLQGDMTEPDALSAAAVDRARAVFLAAGQPLTNMQAARVVRAMALPRAQGGPRVAALVDEADTLEPLLESLGLERDDLVDQFAHAARSLCAEPAVVDALARIASTQAPARIAILGFGRFGQAVLRRLLADPSLPPLQVELVDRRAPERAVAFHTATEHRGWIVQAPPRGDAERWVAELAGRPEAEHPGLVFLCVDNDPLSLRCAARIRRCDTRAAVVLRIARPLQDPGQAGSGASVVTCSVSELFGQTVGPLLDTA